MYSQFMMHGQKNIVLIYFTIRTMYTELHISAYFLTLTEWSIFTQRLQAHNSPVIDTAGIVQLPTTLDAEGQDNSNPPNLAAPNYIITQYSRRNKQL